MKGYTIQHSIDLLEKAVEDNGGSGGGGTAADVSYSNTSSGLVATNVQSAIDEIDGSVDTLETNVGGLETNVVNLNARGDYGDETVIGYVGDAPVYRKIIDFGALPNASSKSVAHGITNLDITKIYTLSGVASRTSPTLQAVVMPYVDEGTTNRGRLIIDDVNVSFITSGDMSNFTNSNITVIYQKTAINSTRSKKK